MNLPNFFAELKRRNVYKVAIAYAVVAWLLMQVASQIFPFFEIPNWAVRLVVLLLIIGFPVALILAWAFELTPQGIKRTELADAEPAKRTGHRVWIYMVVIGGLISIGLFLLGRYTARPAAQREASGPTVQAKSIAVLPFENLSGDPSNAYFADGIQEEILTRLSKIADLKVISRTSTQRYKSAPSNLAEIAKQLGVANILEGTVQKTADQVRVNVQLINAESDSHMWADKFDRKLTDIFAVESEIVAKIVDALQAKLTGDEQHALSSRPTENPEAHQLYLKGRYYWNQRSEEGLKKAIEYFKQAIDADPNYALAYAGLASSYEGLGGVLGFLSPKEFYPKAKAAALKALEIDETLAEAHDALAVYKSNYEWNRSEAEREYRRAIELNPNYAQAHQSYGGYLQLFQRFDEAVAERKRAAELDPLTPLTVADVGYPLYYAHRYDEAIAEFRKALDLDPNFSWSYLWIGQAYLQKGMYEEAIAEMKKAISLSPGDTRMMATLGHAYAASGKRGEALKVLDELKEQSKRRYVSPYFIALIYTGLGEKDQAFEWLEKAYGERHPYLNHLKAEPVFDSIQSDPRLQDLLRRVGLTP